MNKQGFTLVELLVVISIIGLLSNTVAAAAYTASIKSRDVATLDNLREIEKGLELYFNDFGEYPTQNGSDYGLGFCEEDVSVSCFYHSTCVGNCIHPASYLGYSHPTIPGLSAKCLDETGFHETCSGNIYIENIAGIHKGNPPGCFIANPNKCSPIYRKEVSGGYSIVYGQESSVNGVPPGCYRKYAEGKEITDCSVFLPAFPTNPAPPPP